MLQKKSKAVPEGDGPTPQDAYVMITWDELRRVYIVCQYAVISYALDEKVIFG